MNDISLYEKIPEIEQKFPIKVFRQSASSLSPHWHEHIELLHILSGSGTFTCGSKTFYAEAGDTIAVNSNEQHSFTSDDTVNYFCIIINIAFFCDVDFENILLVSKIPPDNEISKYIREMYNEKISEKIGSNMVIKGTAYLLMSHLRRCYTEAHLSKHEYDMRMAKLKKINGILDYIHEHYNEDLSTSVLAKKWFLSEGYICHIFKKASGKTIIQYINDVRIEKAALLLENTDESIAGIASKVGFEDVNYFDRLFKKQTGMSPKKYRNIKAQSLTGRNIAE
ncbi:MAG: AraC family transcriptional regulator [Clostridiales bacterium]|nr:AraC family transcriptional regulator [Clostridiales bacterium]